MISVMVRKVVESAALTGFVFGVLGFIYIAGNAWFHPESLSWPLTHLLPYPREDVFAMCCFAVGAVCLFVYNLVKIDRK